MLKKRLISLTLLVFAQCAAAEEVSFQTVASQIEVGTDSTKSIDKLLGSANVVKEDLMQHPNAATLRWVYYNTEFSAFGGRPYMEILAMDFDANGRVTNFTYNSYGKRNND